MMNFGYNGLLGLLILIGDVWAIIKREEADLDSRSAAAARAGPDSLVLPWAA